MKLITLIVLALVMTVPSFAGVTKFAAKSSYKGAKKAGHYSVKALTFSKKVLF
jgi:hypothetical protein